MPDKPWKKLERDVAALIGGTRFPANQGGVIDCEGPLCAAQVKLVKRLSLEELTQLAEQTEQATSGIGKLGIVAAKIRRGRGFSSPIIVAMTETVFAHLLELASHPCGPAGG